MFSKRWTEVAKQFSYQLVPVEGENESFPRFIGLVAHEKLEAVVEIDAWSDFVKTPWLYKFAAKRYMLDLYGVCQEADFYRWVSHPAVNHDPDGYDWRWQYRDGKLSCVRLIPSAGVTSEETIFLPDVQAVDLPTSRLLH